MEEAQENSTQPSVEGTEEVKSGELAKGHSLLSGAIEKIRGAVSPSPSKVTVESADTDDDSDEDESPPAEKKAFVHPGKEYVDVTKDGPEKIQARIDYLTKGLKGSEESKDMMRKQIDGLTSALETFQEKFGVLEIEKENAKQESTLKNLRQSLRDAIDEGDDDKVLTLQEAIIDHKTEAKLTQKQREAQQHQAEAAVKAQQADPFSDPATVRILQHFAEESDDDGKQIRGWLNATSPDFDKALDRANQFVTERMNKGQPFDPVAMVKDLDQFMKPKKSTKAAEVEVLSGGGDLTSTGNSKKIKLTDAEKYAAKKMGISEESYRKQKAFTAAAQTHRVSIADFN